MLLSLVLNVTARLPSEVRPAQEARGSELEALPPLTSCPSSHLWLIDPHHRQLRNQLLDQSPFWLEAEQSKSNCKIK